MSRKKCTYPFKNNKEIDRYNAHQFAEFRKNFNGEYKEVPLESIKLVSPIHKNAKVNIDNDIDFYRQKNKKVTSAIIVKKIEDDYILFAGWKYYQLAKALSQDTVKIIETDFEDRITMMKAIGCRARLKVCKMTDLYIPSTFDCTIVKPGKLEAIKEYDYKHHAQMKPIVVNKDMVIVDGYSQYIYNRNMEKEYCEVRFKIWLYG